MSQKDRRTYKKDYYQNNKEKFKEFYANRRVKHKILLMYLSGRLKCENDKCGYDKNLAALEFHHRDPNEKEFALTKNRSLKKKLEEIKKCDLLCSNCHREEHNPHMEISNIEEYINSNFTVEYIEKAKG